MKSTMTKVAAVALLAATATGAQAVDLSSGDTLSITSGVNVFDEYGNITNVSSGSFFAMDLNGDSKIQASEKNALTQGTHGITIGKANTALGEITAAWSFSNATGYDWVSTAITGGTAGGLDMSGWTVNWNGGDIDMGAGGAWQVLNGANGMPTSGYTDSTAIFSWDGTNGGTYTLDYTATVPSGGFAGTQYGLHLTGTVTLVPEASTYGMMLAGLGLVGFAVRRRKMVA